MAFTTLDTVVTGDPVTVDRGNLIKSNQDDHEARLTDVEAELATQLPIRFGIVNTIQNVPAGQTGILYHRISAQSTLLGARLTRICAGATGTFEVDVMWKPAASGSFATIFTTRPSVDATDGDFAVSSNAVLSKTSFDINDILRFDLVTKETGNPAAGFLDLEWEVTNV